MKKAGAVLFDLNETVIYQSESQRILIAAAFAEMASYGSGVRLEEFSEKWTSVFEGQKFRYREGRRLLRDGDISAAREKLSEPLHSHLVAMVLTELGFTPLNTLVQAVNSAFQRSWIEGLVMPKENKVVLERLEQEGFRLGLITNFQQPDLLPQILEKFGLSHVFDVVIVSGRVGVRKPHPVLFRLALERLGITRDLGKVIYVGDNPEEDVLGAQLTGMTPILIANKSEMNNPHGVTQIDCLAELLVDVLDLPLAA